MNILNNKNLEELTDKTDLLGLANKSKAIQFFIENLIEDNNVQMIALYGDWGSGKTSIMKDLEKNLTKNKKNNFCSIFFEAWKHEKDDNIALSLLSCLTDNLVRDDVLDETFNNALDLFKSVGTGLSFNFSISDIFGENKAGVKVAPKDMLDSYKKLQSERYNKSFLQVQKNFEKQIGDVEIKILENDKIDIEKGRIVVFLDDLDRCEPNVVLDLLASIKLFYTYGKRLIFVCGIDKLAIQNAVKTKYNDNIKSEEYLEKKRNILTNVYYEGIGGENKQRLPFTTYISHVDSTIFSDQFHDLSLKRIKQIIENKWRANNLQATEKDKVTNQFYTLFLSGTGLTSFSIENPPPSSLYIQQFASNENKVSSDFCLYLLNNFPEFLDEEWSEYYFQNYFKMIQDLL